VPVHIATASRQHHSSAVGNFWEAATSCPCKLTFDLLTLKVVSESRVTWATSVPILVFLGLFLRPDVRDRQTSDAHHRLICPLP